MHTHKNTYKSAYEVVLANTEESKKIHFSLRYQVYCLEKGFEEAAKFTGGLETDEWDDRAVHFLIRHKADNQWIGTFRLIVGTFDKLPINQHAHVEEAHRPNAEKAVVEFSRLAIVRTFQKLRGKMNRNTDDSELCLVFNAIAAGIEYSRRHGIHKIYFLCKPSLARVIRKMGIKCPQIGGKTQFRGVRCPYHFELSGFPLHLFETPHALKQFQLKNTYVDYSLTAVAASSQALREAA